MYPFDVQIISGIALHKGKIVEMQTGEGKTLAAVMPAYLNALSGKGVHVLTFNDYLACRDALWMGPIYEILGLKVCCIKEGMTTGERRRAYLADITYVTAKESGFDYLRDFLCMEKEKLVHRPFHYAIVDEADSILIDEARVPLVIAGDVETNPENLPYYINAIKKLKAEEDYEIDEYGRNVYLTETGVMRVEELLGCGNLYDEENLEHMTRINCALHAEKLLQKNRDYIVRNGRVEIIDEFTGRIADKRHWPDNLQSAVEVKEGIIAQSKGMIMGSMALQHFLRLYPRLSGMTGTARRAAGELREFYGLDVLAIPTNKPCIRIDHDDIIFADKNSKFKALSEEITRVHKTMQPILVGTGSVEESEMLSDMLHKAGVKNRVLNAKNDELEAQIIAKAGELGAVTVSTNMAGRGVDIKLGGEKEQNRAEVARLGGLYVIGANHHESSRVDDQLRGRAGRQGDPGESRFFISLEDDMLRNYGMAKYLKLESHKLQHEIARGQRLVEGYNSDIRRQLWKYSYVIEQQRCIIHNKRMDILLDRAGMELLSSKVPNKYSALMKKLEKDVVYKAEKQITLYSINKCWADYLDFVSYVQEGIHLVSLGSNNPFYEFNRIVTEAFEEMLQEIDKETIRIFESAKIDEEGVTFGGLKLKGPSATWTYLMNDRPDQFSSLPLLFKNASAYIRGTLFSLRSIWHKIAGK